MPMDLSEYPDDWPQISERIRKGRAGNECEWCGAANGKPHPVTGSRVVLTVAHIIPKKHLVDDFNLRALCQRCHLTFDAAHHARNRRYGRRHTRHQRELGFPEPTPGQALARLLAWMERRVSPESVRRERELQQTFCDHA